MALDNENPNYLLWLNDTAPKQMLSQMGAVEILKFWPLIVVKVCRYKSDELKSKLRFMVSRTKNCTHYDRTKQQWFVILRLFEKQESMNILSCTFLTMLFLCECPKKIHTHAFPITPLDTR